MIKNFPCLLPPKLCWTLFGFSLFLFHGAVNSAEVVGKLSGEMSVSQGSLSYQLPLGVPAGIHGMKPQLSLNYSPQGLTGSVGLGFSLSASSGITRCTPNMLNDGFEAAIQLDGLSRFCHDGQRLISVSGEDGTSGAQYRTFDNNNVKYTSNGGSNHTPDSWTVQEPNGTTLTFERKGLTQSTQDQFATWFLTRRSDTFSNHINYLYSDDAVAVLESITYSGYEITFEYEEKLSAIGQYQAGEYITANKLLDKIVVSSPQGSLLFYYDLTYKLIPESTNAQRLHNVTQCFSDSDCLKPVIFGYQDIPSPVATVDRSADQLMVIPKSEYANSTGIDQTPMDERPAFVAADVNGDGFEDFCYYKLQEGIQCALFNEGSYGSLSSWSSDLGYKSDAKAKADGEGDDAGDYSAYGALNMQDLNADGKADFCITDEQGVRCGLSNGSNFTNVHYWTENITNEQSQTLLQRINEDEYLDVCGYDRNMQYHCYAGNGNEFATRLSTFNEPDFANKASWEFQKIIACAGNGGQCYTTSKHKYEINYPSATWVDIDGDFDQDLCWVSESQQGFTCKYASTDPNAKELSYGSPQVLINLSDLITPLILPSSSLVTNPIEQHTLVATNDEALRQSKALTSSFQYANLNGDSLVDICYVIGNELLCRINTGVGFHDAEPWLDLSSLLDPYSGNEREDEQRNAKLSTFRFIDRNLDGRSDVCVIHSEIEQCAYNTGDEFQDFEDRLQIFPDIVADNQLVKEWTSFMHKVFGGHRTHFRFQTTRAAYGNLIEVGDLDGDGFSEFCYRSINGIVCSTNDNFGASALLTKVTDSYGLSTRVNYKNLLLDDLYDEAQEIPEGFIEYPNNARVVASLETDVATVKGIDNTNYTKRVDYRYGGYLVNPVEGIGGFTSMTETQADRNVKAVTKFYIHEEGNKLFGQEKESSQYINDVLVKYQRNDFSVEELSNGTRRLVLDQTETRQYDLLGTLISTATTTNDQLDDYGRPQRVTLNKTHGDESLTTVTISTYENDTSNWILGRATNQTVTHTQLGETVTRVVDFVYTDGVLTEETIQKGANNAVTMKYSDFTGTGYPQRIATTGMADANGAVQTRFITKTYDDLGRVLTETNALNQTVTYEYHEKCGAIEYVTDIAGRKTKTRYNNHCIKTSVEAPDDNQTSWKYEWATAEDNSPLNRPTTTLQGYDYYNPVVYKITETQKSPSTLGDFWTTVYYDAQGRAVRTQSMGFSSANNMRYVNTATVYDKYGYKTAQSRPYFSYENGLSNSIYWITMAYDATGRPKIETKTGPDGYDLIVDYSYTGTSTTISYSDYSKTTVNGIHGKPKSVTENGLTIEYEYNAIGDLHITRNGDLETIVNYDSRGFKANQTDPSMGYWQYKHNAFGELVYQKDAKNQVTTYNFDVMGRKDTRTAKEGVTSWQYHTSGNGKGQPYIESGVAANKLWQYDSQGRVSSETLTVNGKTFTTGFKYNRYSQLTETVQPNGVSVFHKYDNIGKLQNVSLLASDFNDVDFAFLSEQKSDLEAEIARLRALQTQALAKAEYHQKKAVEYHKQYTYFASQLGKVTKELADLGAAAEEHKAAAERYFTLYNTLTAKARELSAQYGGKTFKYDPSLDDGEYYYYTRTYCASHHGWGPSRYCAKYQTNTVPVLQSDMKGSPAGSINPANFYEQAADDYEQLYLAENYAYNSYQKGSTSNSLADMTDTQVQNAISVREQQIRDLTAFFATERESLIEFVINKYSYTKTTIPGVRGGTPQTKINYNRTFSECSTSFIVRGGVIITSYGQTCHDNMKSQIISELQATVLEYEGCNLAVNYVNTSTLNSLCTQAIKPRAELKVYQSDTLSAYYKPVEETYTEDVLVPIMMDGITIMIPAVATKTRIVQEEISANEAVTYFTQQRDENYRLLGEAIASAQAEMDNLDDGVHEDLMTAEESLALIEQKMGIIDADGLDNLLTSQASLATTQGKLTIWHAANRTAEGHLQTELFGNGLYTHREINNETGLVSNIRTGVVDGSIIRDLEYEYDARGRITSKIDSSAHTDGSYDINTQESFYYNDSQGRLSDWSFSQAIQEEAYDPVSGTISTTERDNQLEHTYEHDDVGNLTYKTSAGTMVYDPTTNHLESRTHNGEATSYAYDSNGNLITGDGRSYEWTSFNKVASVSRGGQTVDFTYDASHKRIVKQAANETRYYVNPGYELVERTRNGITETVHRYTIFHENDQVAVFEKTEQAGEESTQQAIYADSISYVHRDILGSGELITDSRMNILARQFFSPYGEKVDDLLKAQSETLGETYQAAKLGTGMIQSESDDLGADLWAEYEQEGEGDALLSRFTAGASAQDLTGVRGFTSHEAIEEIGLINMNARLYDPVIGRFMSADSIVPDLYTPLDHNRYSYVRGNPVIARDPTGHFVEVAVAAAFFAWTHYGDNPQLQMASTVLLSAAMMNPSTTPFAAGANATANAAMHSGLTSLTISFLKTGKIDRKSMENAGIAAASAGLTYQIAHGWIKDNTFIGGGEYEWAKITAAHMVTQGAISDLRGDKFIHGAIAGLVAKSSERLTKGLGTYEGTVVVATLSGVAAEATGGDFAQGAMTGAIIHLYNSCAGGTRCSNREGRTHQNRYRIDRKVITVKEETVIGGTQGFLEDLFGMARYVPTTSVGNIILNTAATNIMSQFGASLDYDWVRVDNVVWEVDQIQVEQIHTLYSQEDGYIFQYYDYEWVDVGEPMFIREISRQGSFKYAK